MWKWIKILGSKYQFEILKCKKKMLKISFLMSLWMSSIPIILGGRSIPTRLISWSQGMMFITGGLANSKRISLSKRFVLIP